jgi:hypothetical protein
MSKSTTKRVAIQQVAKGGKAPHIWLGIDPGQTGALAILGDVKMVFDYEDPSWIDYLETIAQLYHHGYDDVDVKAAIEKVSSMPKQGVASSFKFGTNYGIWQGILKAFQIPYIFVTPQKWQKGVFDSMPRGDRKAMSLDLARRIFPWAQLNLKKHHSRADALLIAYWLKLQGNE